MSGVRGAHLAPLAACAWRSLQGELTCSYIGAPFPANSYSLMIIIHFARNSAGFSLCAFAPLHLCAFAPLFCSRLCAAPSVLLRVFLTLSQHYPIFVSQKFELATQRTKLISYENGMVLYYSNNTMNKSYLTVFIFE